MDLLLTRSFVTVAESGSLTRAANRLGVTQSALTRRIQQHEGQIGAQLLLRGRQGVKLTEVGQLAYREGQRLLATYANLREQVAQHQGLERGQVCIGGGATAVSFLLPSAIAAFQREHPQVLFQLKEAGSSEIAEDVRQGHLELGIVTLPMRSQGLDTRTLMDDDIVLVARREHPLAQRARITIRDLAGEDFVGFEAGTALRRLIDNAAHEAGLEPHVVMELRSIPSILRMVASTGHLAFVSRLALGGQREVVELNLHGLHIRRRLAMVQRRHAPLSVAAQAFMQQLIQA